MQSGAVGFSWAQMRQVQLGSVGCSWVQLGAVGCSWALCGLRRSCGESRVNVPTLVIDH